MSMNNPILVILEDSGLCRDVLRVILDFAWDEIKNKRLTASICRAAIKNGNTSILFKEHMSRSCTMAIMYEACENNSLTIIRWIFGISNCRGSGFRRFLINTCYKKSCWEGKKNILTWILSTGVFIPDLHKGLNIAVNKNNIDIVKYLLSHHIGDIEEAKLAAQAYYIKHDMHVLLNVCSDECYKCLIEPRTTKPLRSRNYLPDHASSLAYCQRLFL